MYTQSTSQPTATHLTGTTHPRIVYFVARSNGTMVPLVPADELPFNIRLQGVPRVLSADQVFGLQMVGSATYTGLTFKLEHNITTPHTRSLSSASSTRDSSVFEHRQYLAPDALARQALTNAATSNTANVLQYPLPLRPSSAHDSATPWRQPPATNPTQSVIDAIIGTQSGAEAAARNGYIPKLTADQVPSGKVPDADKKEFCTYWLRTGECDYAQQGCLYKHEMPDSLEKLQKLGFRQWPYWWRERNQQVRIRTEGDGPILRQGLKPEEWLKKRRESEVEEKGEVSGSDSGASDESDLVVVKKADAIETPSVVTKLMKRSETIKDADDINHTKEVPQQTYAAAILKNKARQPSTTTDGDLICLSEPNTSSIGESSPSDSPLSSKISSTTENLTKPEQAHQAAPTTTPQKVFVPAGESAIVHITNAKKREAKVAKRHERTRLAQEPNNLAVNVSDHKAAIKKANDGLMASRFAAGVEAPRRHPLTPRAASGSERGAAKGLRPRVPKTSPPSPMRSPVLGNGGFTAMVSKAKPPPSSMPNQSPVLSNGGHTIVLSKPKSNASAGILAASSDGFAKFKAGATKKS